MKKSLRCAGRWLMLTLIPGVFGGVLIAAEGGIDLTSPANGAALSTLVPDFAVDLDKSGDVTAARIEIADDPAFASDHVAGLMVMDGGASTLRLPYNLLPDTTYSWRAILLRGDLNDPDAGSTTAVQTFTTGDGQSLPSAPTLLSPADGAGVDAGRHFAELSWSPVTGALEYDLYTHRQDGSTVWTDVSGETATVSVEAGTVLYWWVRARNGMGWGDKSEIRHLLVPAEGGAAPTTEPGYVPNDPYITLTPQGDPGDSDDGGDGQDAGGSAASAGLSLSGEGNIDPGPVFHAGARMDLSASLDGSGQSVDVYVVLALPTGEALSFVGGNLTPGITPAASGISLVEMSDIPLLSITVPAGIPGGDYLWVLAAVRAGEDPLNSASWLASETASFRFE